MKFSVLLLGSALAANVKAPAQAFYLYNNNEIEFVGPFPDDGFLPLFKKSGLVHVDKNTVFLTEGKPNQQGAVWSKRQMSERHWQAVFAFRAKGERIGGNGLAFWYTKDAHRTGTVYGGPDKFDGLGIFIDTFDEETKSETVPMVVGVLGDGNTSFKNPTESSKKEGMIVGSCYKAVRNSDAPVFFRITYFNKHLKVEIDNKSEGNAYSTCFDAYEVDLPMGNYFGVSASTNFYPDKYEVYALRTGIFTTVSRHGDGMIVDKMQENEIFKDQSTLVRLNEAVQFVHEKQKELIADFRLVLGRPANDQLPLNNRLEAFEKDIRHLDNHLDRIEETLHAMMLIMKKDRMAEKASLERTEPDNPILDNIQSNFLGYSLLLVAQVVVTALVILAMRKGSKPPRKSI